MGNQCAQCCCGTRDDRKELRDALGEMPKEGFHIKRYQFKKHGFAEGRYIPSPRITAKSQE